MIILLNSDKKHEPRIVRTCKELNKGSICQGVHDVMHGCIQSRQRLCKPMLMPSNINIIALTLGWCFLSVRFVMKPQLQCSSDAPQWTQVSHWLRQSTENQRERGLIFGSVWTVGEGQWASRQKLGWTLKTGAFCEVACPTTWSAPTVTLRKLATANRLLPSAWHIWPFSGRL